jgi:hypothetical protein
MDWEERIKHLRGSKENALSEEDEEVLEEVLEKVLKAALLLSRLRGLLRWRLCRWSPRCGRSERSKSSRRCECNIRHQVNA